MKLTLEEIRAALALGDFDIQVAHGLMIPEARTNVRPREKSGRPRLGSVLLLLYCKNGQWHLLLTRRPDHLSTHAGQISLPGGRREGEETLAETALRETYEEVGVRPENVELLGQLEKIYIPPTDFEVYPFVGWHEQPLRLRPDPREVAEILEVPLAVLLRPETRQREPWELRGLQVEVPFFRVGENKVWGATAIMLSEFVERLRSVSFT